MLLRRLTHLTRVTSRTHKAADMSPTQKTKLLYQERGDLYQHDAKVTHIETLPVPTEPENSAEQDSHVLFLDETIFHVQGGGQPFDLGTINSGSADFIVSSVRNGDENTVRHSGRFAGNANPTFSSGDQIRMSIDVPRRELNSRIHSAGHILGVAIMRLSRESKLPELVETKAKHYPGDASVEFQGLIDGKAKDMIQEAADALVEEARPLHICFWTKEECHAKGVALPDKVEGNIFRTVDIEGCGAYACGGTHVKDTKSVGKIIVRSIKRQKGQTRVGYAVE